MKIAVWIVSILLAIAFVAVGGMKVLAPADALQQSANGVPVTLLKIAGSAEVLGALGLVLPAATRIAPVLTPLAAAGLTMTMVGATIANAAVDTYYAAPMTIGLGVLSALVGWARVGRYAVRPRKQNVTPSAATA